MKQEFGDKNNQSCKKMVIKNTGQTILVIFKNVTNYFGDIANMAPKEKWYLAK